MVLVPGPARALWAVVPTGTARHDGGKFVPCLGWCLGPQHDPARHEKTIGPDRAGPDRAGLSRARARAVPGGPFGHV